MKNQTAHWIIPVWLGLGGFVAAQQAAPAASAVEGVKGVKQEAISTVKQLETGNAAPIGGVTTGATNNAQAVNKVNGVETINGVKEDGRTVVPPTKVVPPPPPPATQPPPPPPPVTVETINGVKQIGRTVVPPVKAVPPPPPPPHATVQSVKGVAGLDTAKIQNLEAALKLKQDANTPAGTGAEKGGKGKAAAAALLGAPLDKPNPKAPKEDGRAGFQEFEKLQNNGS